jgi:hypothetical protein
LQKHKIRGLKIHCRRFHAYAMMIIVTTLYKPGIELANQVTAFISLHFSHKRNFFWIKEGEEEAVDAQ